MLWSWSWTRQAFYFWNSSNFMETFPIVLTSSTWCESCDIYIHVYPPCPSELENPSSLWSSDFSGKWYFKTLSELPKARDSFWSMPFGWQERKTYAHMLVWILCILGNLMIFLSQFIESSPNVFWRVLYPSLYSNSSICS